MKRCFSWYGVGAGEEFIDQDSKGFTEVYCDLGGGTQKRNAKNGRSESSGTAID